MYLLIINTAMEFISKLNNDIITTTENIKVYQSPPVTNPDAVYEEMIDIFKHRWTHAMQMYRDYGPVGCADEDSTVYVMGNRNDNLIYHHIGKYDTTYDVIYFMNNRMSYNSYICNWNVFTKVNVMWKSIKHGMPFVRALPRGENFAVNEPLNTFHTLLYIHNIRAVFVDHIR
jgi:hypothetical protein